MTQTETFGAVAAGSGGSEDTEGSPFNRNRSQKDCMHQVQPPPRVSSTPPLSAVHVSGTRRRTGRGLVLFPVSVLLSNDGQGHGPGTSLVGPEPRPVSTTGSPPGGARRGGSLSRGPDWRNPFCYHRTPMVALEDRPRSGSHGTPGPSSGDQSQRSRHAMHLGVSVLLECPFSV